MDASRYAKLRGSKGFLIGLCAFVGSWLGLSLLTGFDKDHGLINLFLSFEASVSLAFFAVIGEKQHAVLVALLEAIKAEEDQILEDVHKEKKDGVE